jgi:hypothetical protein
MVSGKFIPIRALRAEGLILALARPSSDGIAVHQRSQSAFNLCHSRNSPVSRHGISLGCGNACSVPMF